MITEDSFEYLLSSMPTYIVEVAKKYPAYLCYHSTENAAFHYVIGTYYRAQEDSSEVKVVLIHGRDSASPGTKVFGCDPSQLVRCGCGKWEWPTTEQVEARYHEVAVQGVKRAPNVQNVPLMKYDRIAQPLEVGPLGILPETFDPDEVLKLFVDAPNDKERLHWFKQLAQWLVLGGREPEWDLYADAALRGRFYSSN